MRIRAWLTRALLGAAIAAALVATGCARKPQVLKIAFVPSKDVAKLSEDIKPLVAALEKELGMKVEATIGTNFTSVVESLGSSANPTDVALLNPFGYVLAQRNSGAEVILKAIRRDKDYYRAQFFVRADSGIKTLEDLKNRGKLRWAVPDQVSTSGYLFPAVMLIRMGFNLEDPNQIEIVPAGNHDNTVLAVYNRQADFGTGFEDNRVRPANANPELDLLNNVVVIGYSDPIPNDTVSVRKGLDPKLKQKIIDAFKKIASTEEGKKIIKNIYDWDGVADAKDSDFDIVRAVLDQLNYQPK